MRNRCSVNCNNKQDFPTPGRDGKEREWSGQRVEKRERVVRRENGQERESGKENGQALDGNHPVSLSNPHWPRLQDSPVSPMMMYLNCNSSTDIAVLTLQLRRKELTIPRREEKTQ